MKAFLLHRERDFDWDTKLPKNADDLIQDLGLQTLFDAMAGEDRVIPTVAPKVVLGGLRDVDALLYRQAVLRDCLAHREIVREIYALAEEAITEERRSFWGLTSRYPSTILRRGRDILPMFLAILKRMRLIAEAHADWFASDGFRRFFSMLETELEDDYLAKVDGLLKTVEFPDGILMSVRLGKGNHGTDYVLREFVRPNKNWIERILPPAEDGLTYHIPPRDESGMRALSELGDRGINLVADALGQSTEHILAFFTTLRSELAFYLGCVNLQEQLTAKGEPTCFPAISPAGARIRDGANLYDACLSLLAKERIVGNDAAADGKSMIVITGANRGGKSTFLRSLGIAQLMMECGMFVPANSYRASLSSGVFTHYKREEDASMESGKFDEELKRMNDMVAELSPNAFVLFNESFAATNDREGSEIARQIAEALVDSGVEVAFVTHLYEFAHRLWVERKDTTLFLRAPRSDDGERSFRLAEEEPLPTSYGEDIYYRVFGEAAQFLKS
ncbi:MAG: DNA mismatch repair protein MutS [bacterium]|nr:DNA mismatch repair protein MutS [bacterium]